MSCICRLVSVCARRSRQGHIPFLDFAAHAPRSSRGAHGKHDMTMGVAAVGVVNGKINAHSSGNKLRGTVFTEQAGSVPLWIILWGVLRQSLWQAGRSRLSRKAPRCSTRLNGQRKRAGHGAAVGFPYGQRRACGCSHGSFRPTRL